VRKGGGTLEVKQDGVLKVTEAVIKKDTSEHRPMMSFAEGTFTDDVKTRLTSQVQRSGSGKSHSSRRRGRLQSPGGVRGSGAAQQMQENSQKRGALEIFCNSGEKTPAAGRF